MEVIGNKVAKFDILIQIGAEWTKDIEFYTETTSTGVTAAQSLTGATFSFFLKKNIGDRKKTFNLTLGNGIAIITYTANGIRITATASQTSIEEGDYYFELRRTDLDKAVAAGKAILSFDAK